MLASNLEIWQERGTKLHVFVMDDTFTSISGRGSPPEIDRWYTDGPANIICAVFFPGTEELCLVEKSGRARIYSFLSQGFRYETLFNSQIALSLNRPSQRPAWVQLPPGYEHIASATDASALLVVETPQGTSRKMRVYHRASFGTGTQASGIELDLPASFASATAFAVTSLGQQNVSMLALRPTHQSIESISVEISRKETEYQFRAQSNRVVSSNSVNTDHNALIDCFSEVWGRYPVIPAIKR